MRIFYIEIDKFKQHHSKEFLKSFIGDKVLKTEKRFYEYSIGRYIVKRIAKRFYNIKNPQIVTNELGKPMLKNEDLYFSISHSKNIVIACFDKSPCGIDVEYMKNFDLEKLSKYFNQEFEDLEGFYKFWTKQESEFKLGEKVSDIYTCILNSEYFVSVVSSSKIIIEIFSAL